MPSRAADRILGVLDECCDSFTFPMLDNGYVYLAATRMTLHRSDAHWGIVIEVFGFSPRTGIPDTCIYTFSNALRRRAAASDFASMDAYRRYLGNNPWNESDFVLPIEKGDWLDSDDTELIAIGMRNVSVRGRTRPMPVASDYATAGVTHSKLPRIATFEFCRAIACIARDEVLATPAERSANLLPEMRQILQLEEWNHPDVVVDDERPSGSETFQQIARVLVTGDVNEYKPSLSPNTHWKFWPEGGSL